MRWRLLLAATIALAASLAGATDRAKGELAARPGAASLALAAGESKFADGAVAYRPATLPEGPRPLLVLLHGNPQPPEEMVRIFRAWADRCGAIMIAPKARKQTWDVIDRWFSLQTRRSAPTRPPVRFGADVPIIEGDLAQLFRLAPIDPARVTLLGFSDGASYALSVGLANPQLFHHVIALSPGFAIYPDRVSLDQKLFIAHGDRDSRLPFERSRDGLVGAIRGAGISVVFRPFHGDHVIDGPATREALLWATGCARP